MQQKQSHILLLLFMMMTIAACGEVAYSSPDKQESTSTPAPSSQLPPADSTAILDYVLLQNPYTAWDTWQPSETTNEDRPEVLISDIQAPEVVELGENFTLTVTIFSTDATQAQLAIFMAGTVMASEVVELQSGENTFGYDLLVDATSRNVLFEVQVTPLGEDSFFQNNRLSTLVTVNASPIVLLVATDEADTTSMQNILQNADIQFEIRTPNELPSDILSLISYESVILVDVSGRDLSIEFMETLQVYVHDFGGGLVVLGGTNSYGLGGYDVTPLAEILPLDMQSQDVESSPQQTILFVVDQSGSMEMIGSNGLSILDTVKASVVQSLDLLSDTDHIGVLAFDARPYIVVETDELGDASNREVIASRIETLRAGGGSDLYGAVRLAGEELISDTSEIKHIIIITDGGSNPRGISETIESLYTENNVTISIIAPNQNFDPTLPDFATAGNGHFYALADLEQLASTIATDISSFTSNNIVEGTIESVIINVDHPILSGIDDVPSLDGYIATTAKETASVILQTPDEDPLLTVWDYGAGRVVAFTSSVSEQWTTAWNSWENNADFWRQVIDWSSPEATPNSEYFDMRIVQNGAGAVLVVDASDGGDPLNDLNLEATIILGSDNHPYRASMIQIESGHYELAFPYSDGFYYVSVVGDVNNTPQQTRTMGILPYPETYGLTNILEPVEDFTQYLPSDVPHGNTIRLFVNDVALAGLDSLEVMRYPTLPAGSMIVLENYAGTFENPGDLVSLSIMYKIEGFNPDGNDWFWVQADMPDNLIRFDGAAEFCQVCHENYGENDYIQSYWLDIR